MMSQDVGVAKGAGRKPATAGSLNAPPLRVLALARYGRLGASSRYRILQYIDLLASRGISVDVHSLLGNHYIEALYARRRQNLGALAIAYLQRLVQLTRVARYDLIWIEGEILPWLPPIAERALCSMRRPYVVEYDDAWFHRYALHRNSLVRAALGKKINKVMALSTRVIAGNAYIADQAYASGARHVTIIPTGVNVSDYRVSPGPPCNQVKIGWIGSPSTSDYLALVREPLQRLQQETGCAVMLIGAREDALAGVRVEHRKWSEASEARDLAQIDIGIGPLPDEPWERGKCALKVLQYMAAAKPVVVSPVGANATVVDEGINGFYATDPESWYTALKTLLTNQHLRRTMGEANRAKVEAHYDIHVLVDRITQSLKEAALASSRFFKPV